MKKILCIALCAVFAACITGCSNDSSDKTAESSSTNTDSKAQVEEASEGSYDLAFSARDCKATFDESNACKIDFTNGSVNIAGDGATADGTAVTITKEGTYIIKGECGNGQIIVDAPDNEKLQLVLNGLKLSGSTSPLLIKSADKVFITLAENSENSLSDSENYELTVDDSNVDAAVFSKADLTINGSGSLDVNGNFAHGIVSKDDLVITGGKLNVSSVKSGLDGKDCLKIKDSTITVNSGSDALRSTNTEETDIRGFVYIESGTFNLNSTNDAIQACSLLRIDGGDFEIVTGGGSSNGETHTDFERPGMERFGSSSDTSDSESAKAIKSADKILINGGTFNIDSSDDALHSGNSLTISDGEINISTGDDGIHSDSTLVLDGGTINIENSYEGLEAGNITINNGNISLVSSDDGINASADGAAASLTISGGNILVDASGDGLDSNGMLEITGGVTLVSGSENGGNGALDYDSSATISGGTLVALGSSGMSQSITGDGQCTISTNISAQGENTSFALYDKNGKELVSFTPPKSYNNVVVSTPDLVQGETYTVKCGGEEVTSITLSTENYDDAGSMGGGMKGGGMKGGGMRGRGEDNFF